MQSTGYYSSQPTYMVQQPNNSLLPGILRQPPPQQQQQPQQPQSQQQQQQQQQQLPQLGQVIMDNGQLDNTEDLDEDDDEDEKKPAKRSGRRKIKIEYIEDKTRRHITFSKRKAGIMKKAYELSTLTGTQVLLLVVSETGLVYTFTTPKLQPLVTKPEGKNLIQSCLNAPDTDETVI
ncbi:Putative MADS-box transcription factor, other eukaryote [Rhizopus microsporus]|nr:Putative MADS-box transcription factor, other eukaryote [Rhizopus microsporus]CEI95484.1 Putative MADS-box transcription factor, other eukaryote [Rhizopus microsporus]